MKILIAGICGFVGSSIAHHILESKPGTKIIGIDNLLRSGSWNNKQSLVNKGVHFIHGDIRLQADLNEIGPISWIIDAAAVPSVTSGLEGAFTPHQVLQHNLFGTANLAELARQRGAGIVFLSTSRVYSITQMKDVEIQTLGDRYHAVVGDDTTRGLSLLGISERFSTESPISFYGASKLACEKILMEYAEAFEMPVHINRCGVLAGAGQFARPDQGIIPFWIHSWHSRSSLKYIGFDGRGLQVRDCLHPRDLAELVLLQIEKGSFVPHPILNVSGGMNNSFSLKELSEWCYERLGSHTVESSPENRKYDVPWLVLDSSAAKRVWGWTPSISKKDIFSEVATFAENNPDWVALCS